ncbi:MAG: GNAT family N-acetyltransferase [Bacteroidetes bacterium]|nr:MAG: GNAT family N-acetyltransferase [Bacteroidota bacterium]
MDIRHLRRDEVDAQRWDRVVSGWPYETVYPYSWYLDLVSPGWSALVAGDYGYIMPLTWKKMLGIRYLYQPVSTQQLGIISRDGKEPAADVLRRFLGFLPGYFHLGSYAFNRGNHVEQSPDFLVEERINYELDLSASYERIRRGYATNTRRNLNRAVRSGLDQGGDITPEEFLERRRACDPFRRGDRFYDVVTRLTNGLVQDGRGAIRGVRKGDRLIAAALFAFSRKRAVYLHSFSDEEGREYRSMFQIVDSLIRTHSGKGMVLDFEGSMVPTIARFFEGFGAEPTVYQRVRFNRFSRNLLRRKNNA